MNRVKGSLYWVGLAAAFAQCAEAECRQALALGLDVSGSVDAREYRLQLEGLAHALSAPDVRDAILGPPNAPIELLVFEWSGTKDTSVIIPWTSLANDNVLDTIILTLNETQRRDANPGTALGLAMETGARFLSERAHCWKRTLDISGDGKSNLGPRPRDVRTRLDGRTMTINALVIGADAPTVADTRQTQVGELVAYFDADVILGPDAFVETALGYDQYAEAMARKLLREIETLNLTSNSFVPD